MELLAGTLAELHGRRLHHGIALVGWRRLLNLLVCTWSRLLRLLLWWRLVGGLVDHVLDSLKRL